MAKRPNPPKKPVKTPKSKAHRPDVRPIGPALAELLNPAINRGEAGVGSTTGTRLAKRDSSFSPPPTRIARGGEGSGVGGATEALPPGPPPSPTLPRKGEGSERAQAGGEKNSGLRPPPDNSKDRRSGGEAAVHRARASTRGTSDDVAKRDAGAAHRDAVTKRGSSDEVAKRDAVAKRDDASFSPPPAREARGGEGSGVGGGSASSRSLSGAEFAEAPPTPDPSPPLRGGRGEERRGFSEAPQDVAKRDAGAKRGTSDEVAKRDAASFSPPPAREARGGEGAGVGGASANSVPERERELAEPPPTPDPSPPLRGGGGADRPGFGEAPQGEFAPANYGTSATIPALDPELARQLGFTTEEEDAAAMARPARNRMEALGVAATADALENLIREGRPEFKGEDGQLKIWTPHRPPRPEKSEGGVRFVIKSEYEPKGDQPTAIAELVEGIQRNDRTQVLLGVTGSGKTYTMAKVIEATQRPAIILAPNKTLAAQLYGEFKSFFPDNAVEYFVSYYDYYQPEAYVPRTDTYIEKESSINEQIDRMRHSATRALLERDDVIIVASVSCIYGIGSVETYTAMTFALKKGERIDQRQLIADLVALQYKRTQADFARGT